MDDHLLFRQDARFGIAARPIVQTRQWTVVIGIVHLTHDEFSLVLWLGILAGQSTCVNPRETVNGDFARFLESRGLSGENEIRAFRVSVIRNFNRDVDGTLANGVQRRIKTAPLEVLLFDVIGDSLRGDQEQILGDVMDPGRDHAQGDPGEDVGVIALPGLVRLAVVLDLAERRARREYASTLKPNRHRLAPEEPRSPTL